jgi:hypothetical protein
MRVLTLSLWQRFGAWTDRRSVLIDELCAMQPDLMAFHDSIKTDEYDPTTDLLDPTQKSTSPAWHPRCTDARIMTMHTIFLVKDELQSAGRDEPVLTSYPMGGALAATLPLTSAALTDAPRIMRIVAAIEVDPAHGLDAYFTRSKAVRRASGELQLDQFISVSADGTVTYRRINCPPIANPEQDKTPIVSA